MIMQRICCISLILCVVACANDAPDPGDVFNRFGLIEAGPGALAESDLEVQAVALVDAATVRAYGVFEDFSSEAVAQAFIRAHERGVDVRIAGDIDRRQQRGFALLEAAGVHTRFGNGALDFELEPTRRATSDGDASRVTHNFIVVDSVRVLNLSGGFLAGESHQLGFEVTSEDIGRDFEDEAVQMTGGVFATTYDNYNGLLKSDVNNRRHYRTDSGDLEIYFGPQERLMKRIIDATYAAKSSVFIVGEGLENVFLAEALRYKAMNRFEVAIVLDESLRTDNHPVAEALISDLNDMRGDGDVLPDVRFHPDVQLNMVIIDANDSPHDGRSYATKVFVLSQPLVASSGFIRAGQGYQGRAADSLMDSNMWVLNRIPGLRERNVDSLIGLFQSFFTEGG